MLLNLEILLALSSSGINQPIVQSQGLVLHTNLETKPPVAVFLVNEVPAFLVFICLIASGL